jgi:hypothetical protein
MEVEDRSSYSRKLFADEFDELSKIVWPSDVDRTFMNEDFKNWIGQGFQIAQNIKFQIGFHQVKNGPCGLLAAVNARLIKQLAFGDPALLSDTKVPTPDQVEDSLIVCLSNILFQTNVKADCFNIVLQEDVTQPLSLTSADNLTVNLIEKIDVVTFLTKNKSQFINAGGAVLFLYSLVISRGLEQTQVDLKVGSYGTTLVVGDFALCTQALVNLCTIGQALPGIDDEVMDRYDGEIEIGMLTFEEVDNMTFGSGYSVLADSLKHPKYPIWILHGGDHYTILFSFDSEALNLGVPKKKSGASEFDSNKCVNDCGFFGNSEWYGYCKKCYDQLTEANNKISTEPVNCAGKCSFFGNPATFNYCSLCYKSLSQSKIQELKELETAQIEIDRALKATLKPNALAILEKDYEIKFFHFNGLPPSGPRMASINLARRTSIDNNQNNETDQNIVKNVAMLVQRKWVGTELDGDWMYEVALRYDKDHKPSGDQAIPNEKWRCNSCVVNQLFGFNEANNEICEVCHLSIKEVGQTIWIKYNQLNSLLRREVDTNYQPKIVTLLHTRWPKTLVEFTGQKPPTI